MKHSKWNTKISFFVAFNIVLILVVIKSFIIDPNIARIITYSAIRDFFAVKRSCLDILPERYHYIYYSDGGYVFWSEGIMGQISLLKIPKDYNKNARNLLRAENSDSLHKFISCVSKNYPKETK